MTFPAKTKISVRQHVGHRLTVMATASFIAASISGCVSPTLDMRPAAGFFDEAPTQNRPVTRPVRAVTSFSESLACMDRILADLDIGTTLITSKNISDPTTRASVATKEMVITTLSQMSRVSNAFRFVDYEVDIIRQDTVQNLTGLLLNANQIQLQRPALYISGAIAYVDQGILRNGEQAGTSASRLELGYSADWNATLIGLELHLGDFRTRTLVPGIDSANDIVFGSRGQGLDAAARISRYGVQFNLSRSTTMGAGAAVRTLVELGLIEIIGKWARVPYWQCLMLDRTNPAFERQFRDWFDDLKGSIFDGPVGVSSPDKQVLYTKRALTAAGYYAGPLDAKRDAAFGVALARFQSDQGLIPSGSLTFDTFQKLFQDYVKVDDEGRLQQVAWDKIKAVRPPLAVHLELANQQFVPGQFTPNERIYMAASVSREAYLYCFYQDVLGRVSRLFPNPFQRATALPGNRLLRIPDWLVLNPGFSIRAGEPGIERARCYATEQDILGQLPPIVQQTAILPLNGVNSLDAIEQMFASLPTETEVVSSGIQWTITQPPVKVSQKPATPPATQQAAPPTNFKFASQRRQLKFPDAPLGFYRVIEGETLQHIALKTGVTLPELQQLNRIDNPNEILTGRLLRLIQRVRDTQQTNADMADEAPDAPAAQSNSDDDVTTSPKQAAPPPGVEKRVERSPDSGKSTDAALHTPASDTKQRMIIDLEAPALQRVPVTEQLVL
mgnify:CR=1 FL=1